MLVFGKTCEELWRKYAIIAIDIDIDTRESIGTFPITNGKISANSFCIYTKLFFSKKATLNWMDV